MMIRWYRGAALIFFNCLVLFLFINVISWAILSCMNGPDKSLEKIYTSANFQKAYPQYRADEIDRLQDETHSRGFIYDPYQVYREAPYSGRYVNVSANGYRVNSTNQPDVNDTSVIPIFIFGGSTTFGYGVADSSTVAAYLNRRMKEVNPSYCVYNFGAGGYFSDQELIWFKRKLAIKNKPVTAVFLDGLNELSIRGDEPLFAGSIRGLLGSMKLSQDMQASRSFHDLYLSRLPVVKLYDQITQSKGTLISQKQGNINLDEIHHLVERYRTNCRTENAIASLYGVRTLFVIQPVPQYEYDLNYHVFKGDPALDDPYIKAGYGQMKALGADSSLTWLWLGEMQHDVKKNLYVDNVHYTPEMNRMIADSIFQKLSSIIPLHDVHR